MQNSNLICKDSETICKNYLEGNCKTVESSIFTGKQFSEVLRRVQNLNEDRVQRDVAPWVVPSTATLSFAVSSRLAKLARSLMRNGSDMLRWGVQGLSPILRVAFY